jgi:hypothetical protein
VADGLSTLNLLMRRLQVPRLLVLLLVFGRILDYLYPESAISIPN